LLRRYASRNDTSGETAGDRTAHGLTSGEDRA
jgi:hypothetical protein